MIPNRIQEKGILAKLLEQGIKVLLKKECKKINNLGWHSKISIDEGILQTVTHLD